jgi:5-bromo-4-chloroindolyl phosphate hydrolysis protein
VSDLSKNNTPGSNKKIGDIVKSALQGDLSKLKDLGPAMQHYYEDFSMTVHEWEAKSNNTMSNVTPKAQAGSTPDTDKQAEPDNNQSSTAQGFLPALWETLSRANTRRIRRIPHIPHIPRGLPQIILASIGLFISGLCTLTFSILSLILPLKVVFIPLATVFGVAALACTGFLGAGIRKRRLAGRVTQLAGLLQRKKVYSFDELAAETGRTPKQIKKDLRKARAKGMLPEVRVDDAGTCVMWGEDLYRQYLETKKAHRQKENEARERRNRLQDPVTADLELIRSEGETTVKKIRTANEAIPDKIINGKLSTLEDITARIFAYVEQHPEKLPDTRKFMSYYLPTTLKLIEKYCQYEELDFQPDNVRQAKQDISRTLDTINQAFKNLLENLYAHCTLDVSTDIDVLEKMLEQEGLTGKKFKIDSPG